MVIKNKEGASHSGDFILVEEELVSKFNSKTKAIIVNTPNNPLGKVFSRKELEFIAQLCKQHDVLCIMDEVYEWLVYEPYEHVRMGRFFSSRQLIFQALDSIELQHPFLICGIGPSQLDPPEKHFQSLAGNLDGHTDQSS